jgi:hypothetical protein
MPTSAALPLARSEPRTRTALLMEGIALRHQIAVLERSGTSRPCFRRWDRLFWMLFSRWWSGWRESLVIVQPETVLRWRRNGWSALWRYRSRGRWRGGRPRVSSEVRHLIAQMARENFLWGVRHGSMASYACSGSASPKPPCRGTCLHQAEGQHSRGGPFFAIKRVHSASIPKSGRRDVLNCMVSPVGLSANDPRWRRLYVPTTSPL